MDWIGLDWTRLDWTILCDWTGLWSAYCVRLGVRLGLSQSQYGVRLALSQSQQIQSLTRDQ